ncbi:hypothetical protein C7T94_05950 [Pedobacter yulinensis]|uniref:Tail specific protease domain-containing protein n=1 Tax=Pedobacter yulinensis TaxID=2126353 RepID=A0A2T3HP92_9SPHI|nr:S41 family peptidase [Pedobacter yulinensis]PST84262.1 hypothetical protein C7T94_05950 [Pedobacter yulinensis]
MILRILFFFVLLAGSARAQLQVWYQTMHTDTAFRLPAGDTRQTVPFYFPAYQTQQAYPEITRALQVTENAQSYLLQTNHPKQPDVFFTRFFTRNIRSLRFSLKTKEKIYPLAAVTLRENGYQLPVESKLESLPAYGPADRLELYVNFEALDPGKPALLVLADAFAGSAQIRKAKSPAAFFQSPPFSPVNAEKQPLHPFDSYGVFGHFPAGQREENYKGTLLIEGKPGPLGQTAIPAVALALMDAYPFYRERRLDKNRILAAARQRFGAFSAAPKSEMVDSISAFIENAYGDPHFRLNSHRKQAKTQTPVYIYQIGAKYVIAAVLDDSLKRHIPMGSELLAIDEVGLTAALKRAGGKAEQLLRRQPGTTVRVAIRDPQGRQSLHSYVVKAQYRIPPNFKPANYTFRFLNDSVAYYRLGKVSHELQIDFINKLDSINMRKKLVLDLRGNGGGDVIGGARFVSYFVTGDFTYSGFQNRSNGARDSIVVDANRSPFRFRPDGRVVILIDEKTSCAAELIAANLKQHNRNVTILGKSASAGALAFVYELLMPDEGVSFLTNSPNEGKLLPGKQSIEGLGIRPDVLVRIDNVQDLQPYRDKVLQTAISR